MSNEMIIKENGGYLAAAINLGDLFSEEMDGLTPTFDRIKIPAGGGISYEVPGDDPSNPDSVKEFKAVILYHHPIHSYYKEKFTGGNNPPDCGSMDGKIGVVAETGECKNCGSCPYAKFGSGDNGGMACKQKRRVYILREGEILPVILTVPTGSLKEFTLKKVQNSTGITFSQVVCSVDRALNPDEQQNINAMSEQVKAFAGHVAITDAE